MLIESIYEENFEEKRIEGKERVRKKLKEINKQSRIGQINWYLFFDPTIWAYATLKDKQNKSLVLRGFQDKILNDKHPAIIVAGGNQTGKTYCVAVKAIHHALHVNNAIGIGISIIRCLPPTQSVYAYPATLIICDEIGFW